MNAPFRRGACPGLSQPMPTGDGLLVRLTPTGATIRPEAFIALCAAARELRQWRDRDHVARKHSSPRPHGTLGRTIGRNDRSHRPAGLRRPCRSCAIALAGSRWRGSARCRRAGRAVARRDRIGVLHRRSRAQGFRRGRWWRSPAPRRRSGRCAAACDGKRRTRVPSRECGRRCRGRTADRRGRVRACRRGSVADA